MVRDSGVALVAQWDNWLVGGLRNSDCLASDDGSWMGNCERNDWEPVGQCGRNSVLVREAWRRNGWGRGLVVVVEAAEELVDEVAFHRVKRNLWVGWRRARDRYREVADLGVGGFRYDIHRDSERSGRIVSWGGHRDDSNAVGIDDAGDDGSGCGVGDCSDWRGQSADRERHEVLVERRGQRVPHSWHRGTCPWADECASSAGRPSAASDLPTDAVIGHSRK